MRAPGESGITLPLDSKARSRLERLQVIEIVGAGKGVEPAPIAEEEEVRAFRWFFRFLARSAYTVPCQKDKDSA